MRYLLLVIFLFAFKCEAQVSANQIKKNATLYGTANNSLSVDTINWIATKHNLTTVSGGGSSSVLPVRISSSDFSGSTYTNSLLVGRIAQIDFDLFSANGSGTLLNLTDNYTFNSETGIITTSADNYMLLFYGEIASDTDSVFVNGSNQPAPIPNDSLANSTISGIPLGSSLANLLNGLYILGGTYNGSSAITLRFDTASASGYYIRRRDSLVTFVTPKQLADSFATHPPSGGSVTSIGITVSNGVLIGGTASPITTSGTFTLQVDSSKYATLKALNDSIAAHPHITIDTLKNGYGVRPLSFNGSANDSVKVDTTAIVAVRDSGYIYYPFRSNPKNYLTSQSNIDTLTLGYGLTGTRFTGLTNVTTTVDSATLSLYYLRIKDSTLYATIYRNSLKLNISDTSAMLANYQRSGNATSGTVTSVGTGYGLSGGTITGAGTLLVDSATLSAKYVRLKDSTVVYYPYRSNPLGYLTANQTISFAPTGDVTGSTTGTTTLAPTLSIGAGRVTNAMLAAAIDTAHGGTGATTTLAARANLGLIKNTDTYRLLGSTIITQSIDLSPTRITTNQSLTDNGIYYQLMETPLAGTTITGVKWYQMVKGIYVADNNNKIGLYSYSAGTLTLVASCANDGTLWQTANSSTYGSKAFSSPYVIVANTAYYVAAIFNESSFTTIPTIGGCANLSNAGVNSVDFTNSAKVFAIIITGSNTDLPASQAMSGLTSTATSIWFGLF